MECHHSKQPPRMLVWLLKHAPKAGPQYLPPTAPWALPRAKHTADFTAASAGGRSTDGRLKGKVRHPSRTCKGTGAQSLRSLGKGRQIGWSGYTRNSREGSERDSAHISFQVWQLAILSTKDERSSAGHCILK